MAILMWLKRVFRLKVSMPLVNKANGTVSRDAAYVHYADNETIGGLQFANIPETDKPLVCDFSSSILSAPLDVI